MFLTILDYWVWIKIKCYVYVYKSNVGHFKPGFPTLCLNPLEYCVELKRVRQGFWDLCLNTHVVMNMYRMTLGQVFTLSIAYLIGLLWQNGGEENYIVSCFRFLLGGKVGYMYLNKLNNAAYSWYFILGSSLVWAMRVTSYMLSPAVNKKATNLINIQHIHIVH